ncbi:MAG: hypothetical protein HY726_16725 [Candidatus Rokubacteria bacterium]|nr:hypothetical protein [Candidatus Rokubacteria bacterium]
MPSLPKLPEFQKLRFEVQVAVVAAALALVGVGGYAGLVAPKDREIRTLKAQLLREGSGPPALVQSSQAVPPIAEEERKLWRQLEARLRQRFPGEKDLPGALEAVAELARSARMELSTLQLQTPTAKPSGPPAGPPGGAPSQPAFQVSPPLALSPSVIKLTAFHRYRDLVQFLEGLDRLRVFVTVESLEVKREESRLSTEMTLRTLRWETS